MSNTVSPGPKTPSVKHQNKNPGPNSLPALSNTEFQEPGSQSKKNQNRNPHLHTPHANEDFRNRKRIDLLHAKADFQEQRLKQIQATLETIEGQYCDIVDILITTQKTRHKT